MVLNACIPALRRVRLTGQEFKITSLSCLEHTHARKQNKNHPKMSNEQSKQMSLAPRIPLSRESVAV